MELENFLFVRLDRDPRSTGKRKGGGVCVYVNQQWSDPNHVSVKERVCVPDVELLCVGLRPYYLPREYSHVILCVVYIHPAAIEKTASETVATVISSQQLKSPDVLCLITGDFNHCNLKKTLPTFYQYVDCPTRMGKILDLFYCNAKEAYCCYSLPPLGKSDHCLIHLLPKYIPLVKRQPPAVKIGQCWTPEACDALRGCMECTDWDVFVDSCGTLDELSVTVTDYLNLCVDTVIPVKEVTQYANSKPWINKRIRELLWRKRSAFARGDRDE